jgi:multidrug resistance efflux pump
MAVLLLAIYTAFCLAAFKLLRVPANKWTLATAALGGVVIVGGLLLAMNYNHPYSSDARLYFYTTPVVPQVKGRVTEVAVRPNVPLRAGDVLFRIDPAPYRYIVDQKKAALAEAEQNVRQLRASLDVARAGANEAEAVRDRAREAFDRFQTGNENAQRSGRPGPFSDAEVENRRGAYLAAEAALAGAEANAERAELALGSQIDGVNTTVARLQADLQDAEYDLAQTTVIAPTDGYVTQLYLKPGMMAVPLPLAPVMVFIHGDDRIFAAAFPQNVLQRLQPGAEAEIAFDAIPGRVFSGRIRTVADAVSQGQLQPSGALLSPEDRNRVPGLALAVIDVTGNLAGYQLPAGSTAQVAAYSDHWQPVAVIRRILLRMKSWIGYVAF